MKKHFLSALFASTSLMLSAAAVPALAAAAAPSIDADDIGGVVTGPKGPEAGVWVIAETGDLGTPHSKIVVTDDQGRYVLPDLPQATYKVWARGYGMKDSAAAEVKPGKTADLQMVVENDPLQAAQLYPASYWMAMLKLPEVSEFPGTGPKGNGIAPQMFSQQMWIANLKENCQQCHQLGNLATREAAGPNKHEAWAARLDVTRARALGDVTLGDSGVRYFSIMQNNLTRFGRNRALAMFADWSERVENGEYPKDKPVRPVGQERNVVITLWDWADEKFIHDEVATDRRNPTVNANGPIYGAESIHGNVGSLHPVTHESTLIPVPALEPGAKINPAETGLHNPMVDQKGRVWLTLSGGEMKGLPICSDGTQNSYAKYFPNPSRVTRRFSMYDPAIGKAETKAVCFGNHHLVFGYDKDNTLYFSGDTNVVGWLNTRVYDENGHDSLKASGWCPSVLDTSGDGKIDPDRNAWQQLREGPAVGGEGGEPAAASPRAEASVLDNRAALDPKKDTRITGFAYGINVSPSDDAVWYAKSQPLVPSGIVRFTKGASPPQTCMAELYEPPKRADGSYVAFNGRGLDVDSKGVVWTGFASGQLGKFDRSKCTTLKGPTAHGQHCPAGWTFYETPGPRMVSAPTVNADMHYLVWVDLHNILGLGKDTPILPGTNSDSLIAFLAADQKWVTMRVPSPMGFYPRGMDGRIDDPKTGWKGRGIWANYGESPIWHLESGAGSYGKVVKFQYRPDPLTH